MGYATQQDMVDEFGEQQLIDLTDRANLGTINATVLARALAHADAEIDSYLRGRYTLPLSTVPVVLRGVACDLSRYRLLDGRPLEVADTRYKTALGWLRDVAAGKANLGLDEQQQAPAAGSGPSYEAPDRIFTKTTLEDF